MQKLENHVSTSLFGGLATLEITKIIMHKFWYDDVKKKYGEKTELCYMYTDSFIVSITIENIEKKVLKMLKGVLIPDTGFDI